MTDRGTVTFMEDGSVVIGTPVGGYSRREAIDEAVDTWGESGLLLLPFPVDVDDRRPRVKLRSESWLSRLGHGGGVLWPW